MSQVRFDELTVGDVSAPLVVDGLSRTDFVRYAGASCDFNPMHHDDTIATRFGNPSVFGHGMLTAGITARVVVGWFGPAALRRYDVRRFEIDRSNQIATNLLGGLLGAASCIWGSGDQCAAMALQQGKGRANGRYTSRTLSLQCSTGRFDVSDDAYDAQPIQRDGKGQAAVLAARDCPAAIR